MNSEPTNNGAKMLNLWPVLSEDSHTEVESEKKTYD